MDEVTSMLAAHGRSLTQGSDSSGDSEAPTMPYECRNHRSGSDAEELRWASAGTHRGPPSVASLGW